MLRAFGPHIRLGKSNKLNLFKEVSPDDCYIIHVLICSYCFRLQQAICRKPIGNSHSRIIIITIITTIIITIIIGPNRRISNMYAYLRYLFCHFDIAGYKWPTKNRDSRESRLGTNCLPLGKYTSRVLMSIDRIASNVCSICTDIQAHIPLCRVHLLEPTELCHSAAATRLQTTCTRLIHTLTTLRCVDGPSYQFHSPAARSLTHSLTPITRCVSRATRMF